MSESTILSEDGQTGGVDNAVDPFEDDEPLACGIEDPEACDSCQ